MSKKNKPKRVMGWKVTGRKLTKGNDGVTTERVERVRTAGVLKKLSSAFFDEFSKVANGDEEDMKGPAPSEEAILTFLKNNPRPKDKAFHEWAESKGYNVHKAEAAAYGILSDLVNKGRSKGNAPKGVAPADVKNGVEIEAEHTPNKTIQRKITDDHNTELKKYYDPKKGLPKMEKKLKKEGGVSGVISRMERENMRTGTTKRNVSKDPELRALFKKLGPKRFMAEVKRHRRQLERK